MASTHITSVHTHTDAQTCRNFLHTVSAKTTTDTVVAPTQADLVHLDALDQWCLQRILGITWHHEYRGPGPH